MARAAGGKSLRNCIKIQQLRVQQLPRSTSQICALTLTRERTLRSEPLFGRAFHALPQVRAHAHDERMTVRVIGGAPTSMWNKELSLLFDVDTLNFHRHLHVANVAPHQSCASLMVSAILFGCPSKRRWTDVA